MPLIALVCALRSGMPPGHLWRDAALVAAVGVLACAMRLVGPRGPAANGLARAGRTRLVPVTGPPAGAWLLAALAGVAVLVAAVATQLAGITPPTWAMGTPAAVLGLGGHAAAALDRAAHRAAGTFVGVGVAALVLAAEPPGAGCSWRCCRC